MASGADHRICAIESVDTRLVSTQQQGTACRSGPGRECLSETDAPQSRLADTPVRIESARLGTPYLGLIRNFGFSVDLDDRTLRMVDYLLVGLWGWMSWEYFPRSHIGKHIKSGGVLSRPHVSS